MFLRILLTLLSVLSVILNSSGFTTEDNAPLPPRFNVLTLDPTTGNPTLSWTPPSFNPLHPNPKGYIIYVPLDGPQWNPDDGTGWIEIDTVSADVLTYTDFNNTGNESSIHYTIASLGSSEPSQLTNHHGSMYLTAEYDSCGNKLDIRWNHYVGWGNRIERYDIYLSQSQNLNTFTKVGTVGGNQNLFYYTIPPNQKYYLFVEAKRTDEELYSKSNMAYINTKIAVQPDFMYIDSIIAKDTQTEVHFRIDNNTEYRNFSLVRWESSDSISSLFTAKRLLDFSDPSTIYFADSSDSWTARSRPLFFKINAYDGCNRLTRVSNLSNSITARALTRNKETTIYWDRFYSAKSNPVTYKLYRISYSPNPNPPELIYQVENPSEYSYVDNFEAFEGQGYLPQFCFYVEASETLGGGLSDRISRSRTFCTEISPQIYMPNAIDPLSTHMYQGIPRNIFAPTITFTATYRLIIYNRWGGIVFQGNNEGWNGRLGNGDYAKEGAYVYRLEVYTESKRRFSRTGTVNVIYGPNP